MNVAAAPAWMNDWSIVGGYAKHLPTGLVVHNQETVTSDGRFDWVTSSLQGLNDGVQEAVRAQALELWNAGKLGPVHSSTPPGIKLG